jgi:hypothetical protein
MVLVVLSSRVFGASSIPAIWAPMLPISVWTRLRYVSCGFHFYYMASLPRMHGKSSQPFLRAVNRPTAMSVVGRADWDGTMAYTVNQFVPAFPMAYPGTPWAP